MTNNSPGANPNASIQMLLLKKKLDQKNFVIQQQMRENDDLKREILQLNRKIRKIGIIRDGSQEIGVQTESCLQEIGVQTVVQKVDHEKETILKQEKSFASKSGSGCFSFCRKKGKHDRLLKIIRKDNLKKLMKRKNEILSVLSNPGPTDHLLSWAIQSKSPKCFIWMILEFFVKSQSPNVHLDPDLLQVCIEKEDLSAIIFLLVTVHERIHSQFEIKIGNKLPLQLASKTFRNDIQKMINIVNRYEEQQPKIDSFLEFKERDEPDHMLPMFGQALKAYECMEASLLDFQAFSVQWDYIEYYKERLQHVKKEKKEIDRRARYLDSLFNGENRF